VQHKADMVIAPRINTYVQGGTRMATRTTAPTQQGYPLSGGPLTAPAAVVVPNKPKELRPRRSRARIALGVAIVALSALGTVYLTSMQGQVMQVLAVSSAVTRGEVIDATDLVVVELPAGPSALDPVAAVSLDVVVGQVATTELLPGSLLTMSAFTQALSPEPGSSIVGLLLAANQMPSVPLHAGDPIRLVDVDEPAGGEVAGGEVAAEPASIPAAIVSVGAVGAAGQVVVSVEMDQSQAATWAALAANNRVAIVLEPAGQ
jgi:hypothetical protein